MALGFFGYAREVQLLKDKIRRLEERVNVLEAALLADDRRSLRPSSPPPSYEQAVSTSSEQAKIVLILS